LIQISAVIKRV